MKRISMKHSVKLAVLGLMFTLCLTFVISASAQNVPYSTRSKKAIKKVKPALVEALKEKGLTFGAPIYIRIFKEEKTLEVWVWKGKKASGRFELFKSYHIVTYGGEGLGPKLQEGDGKAPEGFYFVTPSRMNPASSYHLAFNVGYPNAYDRAHGRTGSALMVHGSFVSIGCYAMTNQRIEEIYALADAALRGGQPFFRVHIFPFRMSEEQMVRHRSSNWFSFWKNLKEGYDFFHANGQIPPNVTVKNKRYVFSKPK